MPEFGLPDVTLAVIRQILADFPRVEKAVLFGSRAMGTCRPGSDIDLALMGDDLDLDLLGAIAARLDESPIPYQVDLSLWHLVEHPALREHIVRAGVEFYRRSDLPS